MTTSFFFYDLETSGIAPRDSRIMQFAGQRTDANLVPTGEPVNLFIKMTNDVVPSPDAIMVTGITPQQTVTDGITEAEFLKIFHEEVAVPGTIFVGYNTVRFDDEFMRYLHYRNFYDPYEWQWTDGKSRWDLLDVVRMTRALRPEGISWPFDADGKPTNRLELITKLNGLDHDNAHDALNDVMATIAVAKLIKGLQPKLFDYLLKMRSKKEIAKLVEDGQPFVYSSGKYPAQYEKTTVALRIAEHPTRQGSLVYDLRNDPTPFLGMTAAELAEAWRWKKDSTDQRLPVKTLQYNRCPAVAPMGVLDPDAVQRLEIDLEKIAAHKKLLSQEFIKKVIDAQKLLDQKQQAAFITASTDVDGQLYDGFIGDADKQKLRAVRAADKQTIATVDLTFADERYNTLLPLYKARNFPTSVSDDERSAYESFRTNKLMSGGQKGLLAQYFARLAELSAQSSLTDKQRYALEELQLWGESIMPEEVL